jgi:hypothetical protein
MNFTSFQTYKTKKKEFAKLSPYLMENFRLLATTMRISSHLWSRRSKNWNFTNFSRPEFLSREDLLQQRWTILLNCNKAHLKQKWKMNWWRMLNFALLFNEQENLLMILATYFNESVQCGPLNLVRGEKKPEKLGVPMQHQNIHTLLLLKIIWNFSEKF